MKIVREQTLRPNGGWLTEIDKGQVLRVAAQSVVDFVAYNRADRAEFFDVARTRIYNLNMYPTVGHRLFSKHNNPMMRVMADGFAGKGHHDLQSSNGCGAKMIEVLNPLGVASEDLPDPLGLFRNMAIAQKDGRIVPAPKPLAEPVAVDLAAEIDLIVALVNCPEPKTSPPGADASIVVFVP